MRAGAAFLSVGILWGTQMLAGPCAVAAPPATAATVPTAPMAPRAPSNTPTTDMPAVKQPSLKSCNKLADERELTGRERATFVKDCQAGKSPPDA
jgi:psiF repeat